MRYCRQIRRQRICPLHTMFIITRTAAYLSAQGGFFDVVLINKDSESLGDRIGIDLQCTRNDVIDTLPAGTGSHRRALVT